MMKDVSTDVPEDEVAVAPFEEASHTTLAPEGEVAASRRSVSLPLLAAAGLGLAILIAVPVLGKRLGRQNDTPAMDGEQPALRSVRVIHPGEVADPALMLPADIEGIQRTLLYSRVNGYVRKWTADIGARVTRGMVLAEIDTPEMDQELQQARATLAQGRAEVETVQAELREAQYSFRQAEADLARAKANLEYSRGVHTRNASLREQGVVTQQDFDDSLRDLTAKRADVDSAEAQRRTREAALATREAMIKSRQAAVSSLEANTRRLEEMQTFKKIMAPFDGAVTRRRAEIGMLVTAGNPQTSQELFAVAEVDRLRIKINVPQTFAPSVQVGQSAKVSIPEYPSQTFTAKVARTSGSIDSTSRTLGVELELDNSQGLLLPGAFGKVSLAVRRPERTVSIPVNALVSRTDGPHVAVVDSASAVQLRKIQLGRDYGRTVEVLSGLRGDESLVVNPPDDLADQEKVIVAAPPAKLEKAS